MTQTWTIPPEPVEKKVPVQRAMMLAYLAGVPCVGDPPEMPTIGGEGPRSKAMTTSLVFHLALCGHLRPKRKTIADAFRRFWRRWDVRCTNEPDPQPEPLQRHYWPNIFPPLKDPEE